MWTPKAVRAWIIDVATPLVGIGLAIYLPLTGKLEPWHLPLIAALLGLPWIGREPSGSPNPASSGDASTGSGAPGGSSPAPTPASSSTRSSTSRREDER